MMKPLYDRYRLVKQLLLSVSNATVITTIVSRLTTELEIRFAKCPDALLSRGESAVLRSCPLVAKHMSYIEIK